MNRRQAIRSRTTRRGRSSHSAFAAAACLALLTFASSALAARGHQYLEESIGTPCVEAVCGEGELKEPSAVAVNEATGDIYVLDQGNDRVERFSAAGTFLGGFDGSAIFEPQPGVTEPTTPTPAGSFEYPAGKPQNAALAVDNDPSSPSHGDVYVIDFGSGEGEVACIADKHCAVDKFTASGEYLGQITEAGGILYSNNRALDGLAVDQTGKLWVYREEPRVVDGFAGGEQSGFTPPEIGLVFPGGSGATPQGFAVDSAGDFYASSRPGALPQVAKFDHEGNLLNGACAPEGTRAVAVDQASSAVLTDDATTLTARNAACEARETIDFGGDLLSGAGVGVDHETGFAYVADNTAGHLLVLAPTQPGAPSVLTENQFASEVTSAGAELHSEVNPQSEEGEGPTTYSFQYGPCAGPTSCALSPFPFATPSATLPPDFSAHPVSTELAGLQPGTVYHYRVFAENEHSPAFGSESIFTTQTSGSLLLPDSRQWQMVSPPAKNGARIEPISESGVIEAATDGHAITYLANLPFGAEPQGFTNEVQILSRRGAGAWASRDIAIPHAGATGFGIGNGPEYKMFDPEMSTSLVQPFGQFNPALSAEASESTPYLHDLSEACASCYRPLVTGKAGFANVPKGIVFGEDELCEPRPGKGTHLVCGPEVLGASPDLNYVLLKANAALAPGASAGMLYEWVGGALSPVSVLPEEEVTGESALGLGNQATRGAISEDGTRIAWTSKETLYQRDMARGETVQLDAAQAGCGSCEGGGGVFQIGSSDGSRVLFKDQRPLTAGSGASKGKPDLYECRVAIVADKLTCQLSDLTPKRGEEAAEAVGGVLGASEDASTVYFVARGVQSEAANARGQKAIPGQPNLYVRRGGSTQYITTLSGEDEHDWDGALEGQPTRVSPNGRYLEFMSQARPTGYDNRDRSSGKPVAEVYLYDVETKNLQCASCETSGARPVGVEYFKLEPGSGGLAGGGRETWLKEGLVAANVPGWTQMHAAPAESRYQPPYLTDSGRLFFNSGDALVPQDSNGTQDVYQYEPPGVGDCSEASSSFVAANGGCVNLISAGTSGQESAFMGASESGDDVFFLTSSQLVPQDVDQARDVYDAHVCSAESPCLPEATPPAPACQGEACQPAAAPPGETAPGSPSFSGPGNVVNCPKGKAKRHGKCVKKPKHKKKHHKKGKSKSSSKGNKQRANGEGGGQK